MKVVLITEKPFSTDTVGIIKRIAEEGGHQFSVLEKYTGKQSILEKVTDADAIIIRSDIVDKDVINAAKQLKIVVRAGSGYDNVDLAACTARNIVVMNTPGQNANAVAELVFGMMIFMARNNFTPGTGSELKGKRLGILAYGNIGKIVARLAKCFDMSVMVYDPYVNKDVAEKDGVEYVVNQEELYKRSDYLSLHIPATPETKQSVNHKLMSMMPKNACLLNTARKEIINEQDLLRIMEERPDFKYATDIKPDSDEDLKVFKNRYFSTPKKMGAETNEANVNAGLAAIKQIVDFFATGNRKFQVN